MRARELDLSHLPVPTCKGINGFESYWFSDRHEGEGVRGCGKYMVLAGREGVLWERVDGQERIKAFDTPEDALKALRRVLQKKAEC